MQNIDPIVIKEEKAETRHSLYLAIGVVVLIVIASFFIDMKKAREYVISAGVWAPLILIILKASTMVLAPLSGSPIYPLAGVFFGPVFGTIYIVIGDALGGAISFLLSRKFGRRIMDRLLSKKELSFVDDILDFMGSVKGFLLARIIFSPMPEIVSYTAGLTRINFWPFILIHTLIGIVPALVLVGFGASFSFITTPLGMTIMLVTGTIAVVILGYIFFKYIQPRLLKKSKLD